MRFTLMACCTAVGLADAQPVTLHRVATLEGARAQRELGFVESAAVARNGDVFVLTAPDNRVAKLFLRAGALDVAVLDTRGLGLQAPSQIVARADGSVAILDLAREAVLIAELKGERLFLRSEVPAAGVSSFCAMDDRLAMLVPTADVPIELVTVGSAERRRVGERTSIHGEMRRRAVTDGAIVCFPGEQVVVRASRLRGGMRAYNSDGTLMWAAETAGFRPLLLSGDGVSRLTMTMGPDGYHAIIGVISPGNGTVCSQVAFTATPNKGHRVYDSTATRCQRLADGTGVTTALRWPVAVFGDGNGFISVGGVGTEVTLWRINARER